jgi:hypothetical protein
VEINAVDDENLAIGDDASMFQRTTDPFGKTFHFFVSGEVDEFPFGFGDRNSERESENTGIVHSEIFGIEKATETTLEAANEICCGKVDAFENNNIRVSLSDSASSKCVDWITLLKIGVVGLGLADLLGRITDRKVCGIDHCRIIEKQNSRKSTLKS